MSTVSSTPTPPPAQTLPPSSPDAPSTVTAYQLVKPSGSAGFIVARGIALLFFVLILISMPCALWTINIDTVAMNQDTYKTALSSQNFYGDVLPGLTEALAHSPNQKDNAAVQRSLQVFESNMSDADWQELADKVLPPDWLKHEVDNNISSGFDWLNGTGSLPAFRFDLSQLKEKLTDQNNVLSAVDLLISKMPPCSQSQTKQLSNLDPSVPNGMDNFQLCSPEQGDLKAQVETKVTMVITTAAAQTPAFIDFQQELAKSNTSPQQTQADFDHVRASIGLGNRLVFLLLLVPLALMSLIIILTVRSTKALFRWFGWALILSGLIMLIPVPFLSGLPVLSGLTNAIQQGMGGNNPLFRGLFLGIIGSITNRMTSGIMIQVGIAIVVGFIALIIAVLVPAPDPALSAEIMTITTTQPT